MAGHVVAAVFAANCPIRWSQGSRVMEGRIDPGTITIVPEGEDGYWDIPGSVDGVQMVISPRHLDALGHLSSQRRHGQLSRQLAAPDPGLYCLFEALAGHLASADHWQTLAIDELIDRICMRLLGDQGEGSAKDPGRVWLRDNQLRRVENHLQANLGAGVAMDELAELVGLGRHQFCVAFRVATGSSPQRRLTYFRMLRAKELLADRNALSLAEIASQVGYQTTSGFCRAFKQMFGITARRYRSRR